MHFVYLSFDVAPKGVVWYCTIKRLCGPGVSETCHVLENLKEAFLPSGSFPLTVIMHNDVSSKCSNSTQFWAHSQNNVPKQNHFWPSHFPGLTESDSLHSGYVKSKVYKTQPAKLVALNSELWGGSIGIHKEMLQCVMTAFPQWLQEHMQWPSCHLQSVTFK